MVMSTCSHQAGRRNKARKFVKRLLCPSRTGKDSGHESSQGWQFAADAERVVYPRACQGPRGELTMQIYGPAHVHGAQSISAPHAFRATSAASAPVATRDELEISDAGGFVDLVHDLPEVRQDRVSELRAAIASGRYETADKLDSALSRLLDEIG